MRYKVIFVSGGYKHTDFETDDYDQAQEVRTELINDMRLSGERNFYYIIEDTQAGIDYEIHIV